MKPLMLSTIGILLAMVTICAFPAVPTAANPIVVEPYVEISVQATRSGRPYKEPLSFTIKCSPGPGSIGSVSISCQSFPCKDTIPVFSDTPAEAWFQRPGTFDCRILMTAGDAVPVGTSRYTASMVCGHTVERKVDVTYSEMEAGEGYVLLQEFYNLERVRPCTVTLDLSSRSGSLFVVALVLALLVEIPNVWIMTRFALRLRGLTVWKVVVVGLLATGLTLPIVWFVVPGLLVTWPAIVVGELLVVIVEGLIYACLLRMAVPQAMAMSLVANAASFAAGLLVL